MKILSFLNSIFKIVILFLFFSPFLITVSCGDAGKNNLGKNDSLAPALKVLFEKIERDPKNADLYYERAEYYFTQKDTKGAFDDMNKAIQLEPGKAKYHIRLSDYYFAQNRTRNTRNELIQAVQVEPKNTEALSKLGELYYLVKNYDSAVYYIDRSINCAPENAKPYYEKGMALKEKGDSAKAAASFQTAVEKDPKYYDAFLQLGNIFGAHKDKLCIEYYNNALKLDPKSTDVMYGMGLYYQNIGDKNNARLLYSQLIQLDPKNAYAVYNLGYISLVLDKDPRKAKDLFDKAMVVDPNYADAVYMRGVCFEKLGDKKNAAADFNAAILIDPEHELAMNGLRRLSEKK